MGSDRSVRLTTRASSLAAFFVFCFILLFNKQRFKGKAAAGLGILLDGVVAAARAPDG